jgi:hypothetical protein
MRSSECGMRSGDGLVVVPRTHILSQRREDAKIQTGSRAQTGCRLQATGFRFVGRTGLQVTGSEIILAQRRSGSSADLRASLCREHETHIEWVRVP